jgi:hypothetical protein
MNCSCGNSISGAETKATVNNLIAGDNITLTPNGNLKQNAVTINANVGAGLGTLNVSEGLELFPTHGDLSLGDVTVINTGQKQQFCYLFKTNLATEGGRTNFFKTFADDERFMLLDGYTSRITSQLANDRYVYTNSGVSFQEVGIYYIRGSVSFTSVVQDDNMQLGIATSQKGEFFYEEGSNTFEVVNIGHVLSNETHTRTIEGVLVVDDPFLSVAMILSKSSLLTSESINIFSQTLYINYIGLNIIQEPQNYPTEKYVRNADTFINFVRGFGTLQAWNMSKIDNSVQKLDWTPNSNGRWNSDIGALGGKYASFNPTHRLISNYRLVQANADYTIMLWARFPINVANETNTLIGNNNFRLSLSLVWISSIPYFAVFHNGNIYQSSYAIPTHEQWNHYTITFNSTTGDISIFQNALFVAGGTNINFTTDTFNEAVGHRNDNVLGIEFFFGDIATIEIWNGELLSDVQINDHFANQQRLLN